MGTSEGKRSISRLFFILAVLAVCAVESRASSNDTETATATTTTTKPDLELEHKFDKAAFPTKKPQHHKKRPADPRQHGGSGPKLVMKNNSPVVLDFSSDEIGMGMREGGGGGGGCEAIRCSSPSTVNGTKCKVDAVPPTLNPNLPTMGSRMDCCPVHLCTRGDGSQFLHYGMEAEYDAKFKKNSLMWAAQARNQGPPPQYSADYPAFPDFHSQNTGPSGYSHMPQMRPQPQGFFYGDYQEEEADAFPPNYPPSFSSQFPHNAFGGQGGSGGMKGRGGRLGNKGHVAHQKETAVGGPPRNWPVSKGGGGGGGSLGEAEDDSPYYMGRGEEDEEEEEEEEYVRKKRHDDYYY